MSLDDAFADAVRQPLPRERVEAALGPVNWSVGKTAGFMRSMLDVLGVHTRGHKVSDAALAALCRRHGLPVDGDAEGESIEHNPDDR